LVNTIQDDRSQIVFACMVSAILLGGPFASAWVSSFDGRVLESDSNPNDLEKKLLDSKDDDIGKLPKLA
jgi:hypothetical protein